MQNCSMFSGREFGSGRGMEIIDALDYESGPVQSSLDQSNLSNLSGAMYI